MWTGAVALLLTGAATLGWHSPWLRQQIGQVIAARAGRQAAANDIDAARNNYHRALRFAPRLADARLYLAQLELAQLRPEHAYLELQTLTELHPELAAAWLELAQLMLERGLREEPAQALNRALAIAPDNLPALQLRATLRHDLGQHYGAWLDLRHQLALLPASPQNDARRQRLDQGEADAGKIPALLQALLPPLARTPADQHAAQPDEDRFDGGLPRERWPGGLATLRQQLQTALKKQDLAAAQQLAKKAQQLYPDTVYGPWLQGIVHLAQKQLSEAEVDLRDALAQAPRSRLVITGLTKIWVQTKGAAYAGEQLTQLAARDPDDGFALHMAAVAYLKGRQPTKAEAVLRKGMEWLPQAPQSYRELARFYLELDRAGDASSLCEQGLKLQPQDAPLLSLRARILTALKDNEAAIAAYEQHLRVASDSQESRGMLAKLLVTTRKDAASQQRAHQLVGTLEIDAPTSPAVQDAAGWVTLLAGQPTRALEWLKVAAANAPDEPAIRFHLASAYAQTKDIDAARREVRLSLDSEKPFGERLEAQRLLRELDFPTTLQGSNRVTR